MRGYQRAVEARMRVTFGEEPDAGKAGAVFTVVVMVDQVDIPIVSHVPGPNSRFDQLIVGEVERLEGFLKENPDIGPQALRAKYRPDNFTDLGPRQQWAVDKELRILDWDGDPRK